MGIVVARSTTKADKLSTRRIDEIQYIGNISGLARNQIINIHPVTLMEKNPAQIMSTIIADQTGQMVGKWVEKKSGISGVQTWAKLEGITSSVSSRDLMLLESSNDFRKVRDVGVFKTPGKIMDENTQIALTGLGVQQITVETNIEFTGADSRCALNPTVGKHIHLSPEGRVDMFISALVNMHIPMTNPTAIYTHTDDGGKTTTHVFIHATDNPQTQCSFCADAYGNLHFVWREAVGVNDIRIMYNKYNPTTKTSLIVLEISNITGVPTACPVIQLTPDDTSVEIMWLSNGYAPITNYPQILLREVNADGSMGTLQQLTTDGSATHRYTYISFDYDSLGYRHIMATAKCDTVNPDLGNLWYIRQTSDGWQPKVALNTDAGDVNALHYMSNILISKQNEVYCAYSIGPFDAVSRRPLYIKQIKNGVVGPRVTVEAGNPGPGGTYPNIQFDKNDFVGVIYQSNTVENDAYCLRTFNRMLTEVGTKQIIYEPGDGFELFFFSTPWSTSPNIHSVNPTVPLQGMVMMISKYRPETPEKTDIMVYSTKNCVFGVPTTATKMLVKSYNIRGIISRTKFNAGFNPVI